MVLLISFIARLLYCNYNLADLFYCTTVLLEVWFGWFLLLHDCFIAIMSWLISSITPLFYCNYDLNYFFYWTTVLLQLWVGWFLLLGHCLIAIIISLISSLIILKSWNLTRKRESIDRFENCTLKYWFLEWIWCNFFLDAVFFC